MSLETIGSVIDPVEDWIKLPSEVRLGEVSDIRVDRHDLVHIFNRGSHPMVVVSRDGEFVRSWGEELFPHAHGLDIGPDGTLWLTDDGSHCVRQYTPQGEMLRTIGAPGGPSPYMSGVPFCAPTHTAISPEGDIYVSDGYRNACVHKFSPDGRLIRSWGRSGSGPGEFNVPHNVVCDADGFVYVADRENHRIQVFDGDGRYQTQWNNLHRPCALLLSRGEPPFWLVGELPPTLPVNRTAPNLGPRLSVLNLRGERIATIGDCVPGTGSGQFIAPHGLAFDSQGDLYIADVAASTWSQCFPDLAVPVDLRTMHRLRHILPQIAAMASKHDRKSSP